jgi:hypothetical protein
VKVRLWELPYNGRKSWGRAYSDPAQKHLRRCTNSRLFDQLFLGGGCWKINTVTLTIET